MRLIRYEELTPTPWKNGGGITRELACDPAGAGYDAFRWRASIADVNASGPFSAFPGIDRIILLLDGDGMDLEFGDGRRHFLRQRWIPYRFRGEDVLHSRMAGAPSRDFNLMIRREVATGDLAVWRERCSIDCHGGSVLLFCATGRWRTELPDGVRHELSTQDALCGPAPKGVIIVEPVEPGSVLIAATIQPHAATRGCHAG